MNLHMIRGCSLTANQLPLGESLFPSLCLALLRNNGSHRKIMWERVKGPRTLRSCWMIMTTRKKLKCSSELESQVERKVDLTLRHRLLHYTLEADAPDAIPHWGRPLRQLEVFNDPGLPLYLIGQGFAYCPNCFSLSKDGLHLWLP